MKVATDKYVLGKLQEKELLVSVQKISLDLQGVAECYSNCGVEVWS